MSTPPRSHARALWWWIDRWRRSEGYMDMTLEQQGAFRNLLDEATLRGGALPNDEYVLAKASGDAIAWPRVKSKVMSKFELVDGGWRNRTLDEVNTESRRRAAKQAAYRSRRGGGNDDGNSGGNGSGGQAGNTIQPPDPDKDPYPDPDPDPGNSSGRPAKAPNPLVDRKALWKEGYEHVRVIAKAEDMDLGEVLMKASTKKGRYATRLENMDDDWLLGTVVRLREWRRRVDGLPESPSPPEPSSGKAKKRTESLAAELKGGMKGDGRRLGQGVGDPPDDASGQGS